MRLTSRVRAFGIVTFKEDKEMKLSEKLRAELRSLEYAMLEMEDRDEAWSLEYTRLCRQRRILGRADRKSVV